MKLTPDQIKAVPHFLAGKKGTEIAKAVGVTPQTICAWKKNPEFYAYINRLHQEHLDEARDKMRALSLKAIQTMERILDESDNDEIRRKTAMNILELNGFSDPYDGKYGWGIGPQSAEQIEMEEQKKHANTAPHSTLLEQVLNNCN